MTVLGSLHPDNLIGGDAKIVTEDILIAAAQSLSRGAVLGRMKVSVPVTGTADGSNTGNGTVTLVTGGGKTQEGTYTIENTRVITNGGEFSVFDPSNKFIGSVLIEAGAGGTGVFKGEEINFTITDGSTDFALADSFTVAVTEGVPDTGTADGGNTGNGTITLVQGRRELKVGTYTIECTGAVTHGGVFSVTDPDSLSLPVLTLTTGAGVATAYESKQIALTATDGSTDFIVGDTFTVVVTINPRQCKLLDKTATDGSSVPYAVLSEDIDATSAAKKSIGYLSGQFNELRLTFASGTTVDDVRDAMREVDLYPVAAQPAGLLDPNRSSLG